MDIGEQKMAQQVRHAFVVTSAVNSKFGVFSPEERLAQTLDTIKSIRNKVPTAKIFIMECCGTPVTDEQRLALAKSCDVLIDFSTNADVQAMYDNDNWDVVKNSTEIMCFSRALIMLRDSKQFDDVDRIHKMSGRYKLNNLFDAETYEQTEVQNKIVIGPKYKSQFPESVTTQPWQYMARLWSWPIAQLSEVIEVYQNSLVFFAQRLAAGGYVDIEHVLARFLNPDHVHEIQNLGVEGCIAPNGSAINN